MLKVLDIVEKVGKGGNQFHQLIQTKEDDDKTGFREELLLKESLVIYPGQTLRLRFVPTLPPTVDALVFMPSQMFGIRVHTELDCILRSDDHTPFTPIGDVMICVASKMNIPVTLKPGTSLGNYCEIKKNRLNHFTPFDAEKEAVSELSLTDSGNCADDTLKRIIKKILLEKEVDLDQYKE